MLLCLTKPSMVTKLHIFDIVLYQNVLNPLSWLVFSIRIAITIILLLMVITTRKDTKANEQLNIFYKDQRESSLIQLIGIFINTFWYNRRKTLAYSRYLTSTIIPRHPFHDYRTVKTIQNNYNHYLSVKDRKLR